MEMGFTKPIVKVIVEQLMKQIKQQIGYLIHLNSNIKNLEDQFQKLHDKRCEVQLEIDAAKRNGEIIAPVVQSWVAKVDNNNENLQIFLDEDVKANKMCLEIGRAHV